MIKALAAALCLFCLPVLASNYYVWVCAESQDQVSLLEFDGQNVRTVRNIEVGSFPADIEGPHGINVSPDGRHVYVSISHGKPYGSIHKYETATGEWVDDCTVGMFPATMAISPRTGLLYVVNFNLYGKMEPSTISVVDTKSMDEVAQIPTGIMPHGGRFGPKSRYFYSVNMMNDNLVEIDAHRFEVTRVLDLVSGKEGALPEPMNMGMGSMKDDMASRMKTVVKPTWATTATKNNKTYVAGNGVRTIYEVDLESWSISRRFEKTGKGPYNLEVTSDGKTLIATYKSDKAVGFWDLETGQEKARLETKRRVPHGVVVSNDDRYAFVTVEGIGGEPGTVEVYDIAKLKRVAIAEVGLQAGGIIFWKRGVL